MTSNKVYIIIQDTLTGEREYWTNEYGWVAERGQADEHVNPVSQSTMPIGPLVVQLGVSKY